MSCNMPAPCFWPRSSPSSVERYPEIEIDVQVSNHLMDVVGAGADAGIRYGGTVPEDMVAQRLSADIRWVVAGAPSYLEQYGVPAHPSDLLNHRCQRIRLGNDRIYHWEFERGEETLAIDVPGAITIDDTPFVVSLAAAGAGLAYVPEPYARTLVNQGALRLVLEDWSSMGPGFYAYYPSRRQVPTGLRLLIDLMSRAAPARALGCFCHSMMSQAHHGNDTGPANRWC